MFSKIINRISILLQVFFVIVFGMFLYSLIKVDILPMKYFVLLMIGSSIIFLYHIVCTIFLKNNIWKIISIILSILSICGFYTVYTYLHKTDSFIQSLAVEEQLETYYIAVLSDSSYENITDLNGLNLGTYYTNLDSYTKIMEKINSMVTVSNVHYETLLEMCDALIRGDVSAIMMSEEHKKLIEENNELINIQLKFIYDITTKTKINIVAKDLNVVDEPFTIYITGIDTYGEISSVSRSDVNIVATINPRTKQVLLVTIPRDYYVELHGVDSKDKLTHSGIYGIDMSVTTLEDLLGVDINYYVRLNFSTLIQAVDVLGGIDVYSEYEFNTYGYQFYKGINHVNGKYALAFSRARKNFAAGDRTRGENQMRVIEAIINKIASSRVLVNNYLSILEALGGTFQTNLESNRIYDLVKMQLSSMPTWSVEKYSLNGYDSRNYTYSMGNMLLYVMEPDYNTVNEAKAKIQALKNS